jgi:hypothetical protein
MIAKILITASGKQSQYAKGVLDSVASPLLSFRDRRDRDRRKIFVVVAPAKG